MAKPKIPNQKKKYQALNNRLAKYVILVQDIYESLNNEASKIALGTGYDNSATKPFKFSDYPQTKSKIETLQAKFVNELDTLIYRGTSEEWKQSNLVQDLLADKVLKAYTAQVDRNKYKVYYQTNSDALKAFQQRKEKGMNVSAKLWKQSKTYKEGLEAAISTAIKKGTSAVTLSKQISKYLTEFKSLQKDYKERFGTATKAQDCEYRSIRLARSEINMAYRKAENERWKQMDFVVGYEIKLSERHPEHDMCDMLAGRYPKDFDWTGWHPNDLCYKVPILKTEEEFFADDDAPSPNEVAEVPEGFKKYILENEGQIESAKKRGTLPYFIKDNEKVVKSILFENKNKVLGQPDTAKDIMAKIKGDIGSITKIDISALMASKNEAEESKIIVEMLGRLYGDSADKSLLFDRILNSQSLSEGIKIFREQVFKRGLDNVLESINKLSELQNIDVSKIYGPWMSKFIEYIKVIESKNIPVHGYADVYREIEGAYNIYKLSTSTKAVEYGLHKISINTPYVLIEEYARIYKNPFELLASKEFYDGFEAFVPVVARGLGGTHYDPLYKHIRIASFDRISNSKISARLVQYHEYAHAMDDLQGKWSLSKDWSDLFDKHAKIFNSDIGLDANLMVTNGVSYKNRLWNAYLNSDKSADSLELSTAISDVLVSFDKNHSGFGFGAHGADYFRAKSNCIAEFIAHAAENYWNENTIFAKVTPELYEEMKAMYKKYFNRHKNHE